LILLPSDIVVSDIIGYKERQNLINWFNSLSQTANFRH